MHPALEAFFADADRRYLSPDELKLVGRYAVSLPQRIALYRKLRDNELQIFQPIADQMQLKLPQESEANLERSLQAGILALRNCAMAILLQDEPYWQEHITWFQQQQQNYASQAIDTLMVSLLISQLETVIGPERLKVLKPFLEKLLA